MTRTGLAVGGAILVLLGVGALTWSDSGTAEARTSPLRDVERVTIDSGSGSVDVRHVPGAQGEIRQTRHSWFGGRVEAQHSLSGGRLLLDTDCGWNCSVDYVVTLPTTVPVSGRIGSGSLEVTGMSSVDVEVGSGSITLREVDGPVAAHTGSGSIELAGIGGRIDVDSGSGRIEGSALRAAEVTAHTESGGVELELLSPRSVRVDTGSGGIDVTVPPGRYQVEAETGSGSEEIDVARDPDAPRSLRLSTGSGGIDVETR